jgi:hypothetical protein
MVHGAWCMVHGAWCMIKKEHRSLDLINMISQHTSST